MKKLIRYVSLISVFLYPGGLFAQGLQDSALTRFVNQYDDWKKVVVARNSGFENPWTPYMKRPFYEGLSLKDQKLYLSLQKSGDCFSVIQLDLIGFLTLYPFLIRAFERKDIRASFEGNIAFQHSVGVRRCFAFRSAREASSPKNNINVQKAITLPLKNDRLYSGPFSRSSVRPVSDIDLPGRKKENALMNIYYLAICRDYMPAIRDLEEYSKKKQIILTPIDKTYLSIRSAELGMNGIPTAQLYKLFIREASRNSPEIAQRRTIEKQMFGSIEINFKTHYAKWCGPRSD